MRLLFFLLAISLIGCKALNVDKERYVENNKKTISYALPADIVLEIDNLCDSIEKPLELSKELNTGGIRAKAEVKDNKLSIKIKHDTIFKEKIVYKDKLIEKEKKVTKFKWAKITWFFLFSIILLIAFPKISTLINRIIINLLRLLVI